MVKALEAFEEKVLDTILARSNIEVFGLKATYNKDKVKPLVEYVSILEERGVKVYSVHIYQHNSKNHMVLVGSYIPKIEDLLEKESEKLGLEVKFWRSKIGWIFYDVFSYPQTIIGEPIVTLRYNDFSEVVRGFIRRFRDPGKAIMYYLGLDIGSSLGKWVREVLGIDMLEFGEAYVLGLSIARALGWMIAKVKVLNEESVEVEVYDSIDGRVVGEEYDSCYLIKGLLEGYTSRMFKAEVRGEEVKCVKRGDDMCNFKLKVER